MLKPFMQSTQNSTGTEYDLLNGDEADEGFNRKQYPGTNWDRVMQIYLTICGINAGWWNEEVCLPTTLWKVWHNLVGMYLVGNFCMALMKGSQTYGKCLTLNLMTDVIVVTPPIAYILLRLFLSDDFYRKYTSVVQSSPRRAAVMRKEVLLAIFFTVPVWLFGMVVQQNAIVFWYNYSVYGDFLKFGVPAVHNMLIRTSAGLLNERIAEITQGFTDGSLEPLVFTERCKQTTKQFHLLTRHMKFWIIISTFLNMGMFAVGVLVVLLDVEPGSDENNTILCQQFGPSMKYIVEWVWFFMMWLCMMIGLAEVQRRHRLLIKVVNESGIDRADREYLTGYLKTTVLPFNVCGEHITYNKIGKFMYVLGTMTVYAILRFSSSRR